MQPPDARRGLGFAALAFGSWGLFPLFWKQLAGIPATEQLLHRIVWAALFMLALLAARGRLVEVREVIRDPPRRRWLALSAALLGINWFVFLVAVSTDRVLHASLGYYLNPLISVLLGMVFLGERLRRLQWWAVGFAAAGVVVLVVRAGEVPWIGVLLALAFGFYGLIRKRVDVEPLPGSLFEAGLLAGPCLLGIAAVEASAAGHFVASPKATMLLVCTGLVTALPILWFTAAARRLTMFSLGFMQYIAPTGQFLLAVLVFGEVFTRAHGVAFGFIWLGVGLFATDLLLARRATAPTPAPPRKVFVDPEDRSTP